MEWRQHVLGKQRVLFSLTLLLILCSLFATLVVADECYRVNTCPSNHEALLVDSQGKLSTYYGSQGARLFDESNNNEPLRYPAALYYLQEDATASMAEEVLASQTASYSEAQDVLYATWVLLVDAEQGALSEETRTALDARLRKYFQQSLESIPSDEDRLAVRAARYAYALHIDSSIGNLGGDETWLEGALRDGASSGWSAYHDQTRLAKVTTTLFFLYDQGEGLVRKQAEMTLDYLWAEYALTEQGGRATMPSASTTLENAYDPAATPWYGWSALLLGEPKAPSAIRNPAAYASGYCAPVAVRNLARSVKESRSPYSVTRYFPPPEIGEEKSSVASSVLQGGDVTITAEQGFGNSAAVGDYNGGDHVLRALVRFNASPETFLYFWRSTSNDDAAQPNTESFFAANNVLLGVLAPSYKDDKCAEPHVYAANTDITTSSYDNAYVTAVAGGIMPGDPIVFRIGGRYVALRFFNAVPKASRVAERYGPRYQNVPPSFADDDDWVFFPDPSAGEDHAYFAFEVLPESFVNDALDDWDLDCGGESEGYSCDESDLVLAHVMNHSSFTVDETNKLYYTSVSGIEYEYKQDGVAKIDGSSVVADDYKRFNAFYVNDGVAKPLLEGIGDPVTTVVIRDTYGERLTLDFAATEPGTAKKSEKESSYDCETDGEPATSSGTSDATPAERLAFLAKTFTEQLGDAAYVIDCGTPDEILPNPPTLFTPDSLQGVCAIETAGGRTLGLVYNTVGEADTNGPTPLQELVQSVQSYFPYTGGDPPSEPDPNMCNDAALESDSSNAFVQCSGTISLSGTSYTRLYAYVNGARGLLVLSSDANPFNTGWLADNAVVEWLDSLFGGTTVEGTQGDDATGFDAAYFWQSESNPQKSITARRTGDYANVLCENFDESIEPLTSIEALAGVTTSYLASNTTQGIFIDGVSPSVWQSVTRSLRVNPESSGSPFTYEAECGNGVLELGEECEAVDNTVLRGCSGSPGDIVCVGCLEDDTACHECEDLDNDGFLIADCALANEPVDCYEKKPLYAFDANQASCEGQVCPPAGLTPEQIVNPPASSVCPQCVHPDATEVYDNRDNDCDGENNEEIDAQGGGSEPTSFSCELVNESSCGYVCDTILYECVSDANCSTGEKCLDGSCVAECTTNADCPDGELCLGNGGCYGSTGGGGGGCFSGETLVTLASGSSKPIVDVVVGDEVLGVDGSVNIVEHVFVHDDRAYDLLLVNGGLHVTPEHLLFTSRGWLPAGELVVGDELFDENGVPVVVESVERLEPLLPVYNLETTPSHTFYAGGVLVHNMKATGYGGDNEDTYGTGGWTGVDDGDVSGVDDGSGQGDLPLT